MVGSSCAVCLQIKILLLQNRYNMTVSSSFYMMNRGTGELEGHEQMIPQSGLYNAALWLLHYSKEKIISSPL